MKIKNARLLKREELYFVTEKYRKYKTWWWLDDKGFSFDHIVAVTEEGKLDNLGCAYSNPTLSIRPIIEVTDSTYSVGEIIELPDKEDSTVEFVFFKPDFAFCLQDLGSSQYSEKPCDFENSRIKEVLDEWINKANEFIKEELK